ncbi:MAG: hypothetical protein HY043_09765 [Verrucomicrobia bacterium]|nr:hypothetical protein [Verrucomicrobiota bacterium]
MFITTKPNNRDEKRRHGRFAAAFLAALGLLLTAVGCGTISYSEQAYIGPGYQPKNVFRQSATLPETLRRVAVLPLTSAGADADSDSGRETLAITLRRELGKRAVFELIEVTPTQLKQWTGRSSWLADEPLPPDFFARLSEPTACDAVLFCRLTHFQPSKPIVIGWHFKLVDCREPKTWWSADEVFDSGQAAVVNGARRYSLEHFKASAGATDSQFILNSPQRFGQYTLHMLLESLPAR